MRHVLRHVSGTNLRAARLCSQFGLDIDTFLKQDPFQKGVLVSQHETLVRRAPVGGLQVVEIGLMNADGLLELLDILRAALSKGRLSLAVPLLPLLRGSVNLKGVSTNMYHDGPSN
jgi:hypothetical protein